MWKVKRMNPARIVVLTIAVGIGGLAAYPANGSDNRALPTGPVAQAQTADVSVAGADTGSGQPHEIMNAVRYGALRLTTTPK
jgi:pilus assembly protein CpaB